MTVVNGETVGVLTDTKMLDRCTEAPEDPKTLGCTDIPKVPMTCTGELWGYPDEWGCTDAPYADNLPDISTTIVGKTVLFKDKFLHLKS